MATNKRGWHTPTITLPRIRFGSEQERKDDPALTYYFVIVPALLLSVLGLITGFSAQIVTVIAQGGNPYTAYARPLITILVSLIIATTVFPVPQRRLMYLVPVMFVGVPGFQSLALSLLGRSEGGNANWMKVGPITAQPSKFLEFALIVFLAFMVSKPVSKRGDWKVMSLTAGLPILTALGTAILGRDTDAAMVVAIDALGTMWMIGLPKRWFGGLVVLAVLTMVLLVLSNPTRIRRTLATFSGTSKGPDESAPEQTDHSLWALGSGGLTGLGPGASCEKWNYLQAMRTDFIFVTVGEEFGLLGTPGVLLCLGLLIWDMSRVAREFSDLFVAIVSSGVAPWIGIQTVINVLSVTGPGPVIGVPLSLVSYGGSSFLFTIITIAIVASFARARAGIWMIGHPDEASAGCDPCPVPRRRSVR